MPLQALAGVRVLDLSRYLPGPLLTRVLADLGADVIQIETPTGDPTRYTPPFVGGQSAAYAGLNFGKRSVVLDLKSPTGGAVLAAMLPRVDVVIESFRPGVLARLGFGWETLRALHPGVILCSISGFGQEGPLRERAGHDLTYVARNGVLGMFGPEGQVPPAPGVQIADVGGGALHAAVGILAALLERNRTGEGRHLDVSMARSAAAFLALEAPRRLAGGPEPRGAGMLTGGLPCYRVYATKDGGYMALGALEPKFFAAFCERAGVPHLGGEGFASGARRAEVIGELEATFARHTRAQWVELLDGCDCCCEPVCSPEEALADPALGIPTVDAGGITAIAIHVGAPPVPPAIAAAPALGAHGRAVCKELGVDDALVEAAVAAGAMLPERRDEVLDVAGPLIALTTDFGAGSTYVAQLKGVLYAALPEARIVDVTHDLPAHDVTAAELCLRSTAFAFPIGTTQVVVIDPGVGTERRGIAAEVRGTRFVGPDNGVLGGVLGQPGARCVCLDRPHLFRRPVSPTFHGRDVFAPVAAELAAGVDLSDVGTLIDNPLPTTLPAPTWGDDIVRGETLGADRFGNLITNLAVAEVRARLGDDFEVVLGGRFGGASLPRVETYGEAPPRTLITLAGSDGYLEVSMREASASEHLGAARGLPVACRAPGEG